MTLPAPAGTRKGLGAPAVPGRVGRNFGARRTRVACSNAYAYEISRGSFQRAPKKDTPIGNSPCAYPAGTEMSGYPATAAGPDELTKSVKSSPPGSRVIHAGPLVGPTMASSRFARS